MDLLIGFGAQDDIFCVHIEDIEIEIPGPKEKEFQIQYQHSQIDPRWKFQLIQDTVSQRAFAIVSFSANGLVINWSLKHCCDDLF